MSLWPKNDLGWGWGRKIFIFGGSGPRFFKKNLKKPCFWDLISPTAPIQRPGLVQAGGPKNLTTSDFTIDALDDRSVHFGRKCRFWIEHIAEDRPRPIGSDKKTEKAKCFFLGSIGLRFFIIYIYIYVWVCILYIYIYIYISR